MNLSEEMLTQYGCIRMKCGSVLNNQKMMTIGKHEMETRTNINDFNKIPNVGPATVRHLNILGINKPFELIGQNPYSMFKELCKIVGENLDPCLADVFISAVKFMEGAPPQKWWHYTEERKKTLSKERS